jgi:cell division protein FtsI/penicillin-binding protein 2
MKKQRFNFVLFCFLVIASLIFYKLVELQVVNEDYWKALAQGQHKVFLQTKGDRGGIYIQDRLNNLYPLAVNRSWEHVYISPREIAQKEIDPSEIVERLSQILDINSEELLARIERTDSSYEILKDRLSSEEVNIIKEAKLPAVYIKESDIRYYPQESLASHLVGFLGGESSGQYGVEGYYNQRLEGSVVVQEGEKSPFGYLIQKVTGLSNSGEELVLTIDYNIQFMAEKLLEKAHEDLAIEGGSILVGDPHTGEILAMANYPTFNPNEYFIEKDLSIFINPTIQIPYEPGSIFKPITMAIGLEEGKITPETVYDDPGEIKIGGYTIKNYAQRRWGKVSMTEALEKSINTAAVFAQKSVGNSVFYDYLEKFELFDLTGIDLQGEVNSPNKSFKEGYEVNFATASFGQGVNFTSIQLLKSFSALANGGRLINPHIIQKDNSSYGKRVISQKTSADITSMMVSVTEKGYAKSARVNGYYVAGKTGTAQVPWSVLGIPKIGYSDKTIQSFIGYAPAFDPSFIILVKLDNPRAQTSEYSAAPIFGELAKYIVDYYQIPPERTEE